MRRSAVLVLAALALVASAFPATARAQAVHDGWTGMLSGTFEGLFRVRGWCGEEVVVTGTHRVRFWATTTPTGRVAATGQSVFTNVTGVGLTTGETYRLVEVDGSSHQLEAAVDDPYVEIRVETFEQRLVFIGGGHIFTLRFLAHVTFTPTGELAVAFQTVDSECRDVGGP
jgi:hypothetical protein